MPVDMKRFYVDKSGVLFYTTYFLKSRLTSYISACLKFQQDIKMVMQSQKQLVDIVGKFTPKIVKMDGAAHKTWKKKKDEIVGE